MPGDSTGSNDAWKFDERGEVVFPGLFVSSCDEECVRKETVKPR